MLDWRYWKRHGVPNSTMLAKPLGFPDVLAAIGATAELGK
jgi:hypothetical protein